MRVIQEVRKVEVASCDVDHSKVSQGFAQLGLVIIKMFAKRLAARDRYDGSAGFQRCQQ